MMHYPARTRRREAIAQAGYIRDPLAHAIECPTGTGTGSFEFEARGLYRIAMQLLHFH